MEKPTDSILEKEYNLSLTKMKDSLITYTVCMYAGNLAGDENDPEHLDLMRKQVADIVNCYKQAVDDAQKMNLPNYARQVFYNFRNYFEQLDPKIKNLFLVRKDMEEILRRVVTENKLDFPENSEADEGNIIWVDFKDKKRK